VGPPRLRPRAVAAGDSGVIVYGDDRNSAGADAVFDDVHLLDPRLRDVQRLTYTASDWCFHSNHDGDADIYTVKPSKAPASRSPRPSRCRPRPRTC